MVHVLLTHFRSTFTQVAVLLGQTPELRRRLLDEARWVVTKIAKTTKMGGNDGAQGLPQETNWFSGMILLMEEILHHLGCMKPCK